MYTEYNMFTVREILFNAVSNLKLGITVGRNTGQPYVHTAIRSPYHRVHNGTMFPRSGVLRSYGPKFPRA